MRLEGKVALVTGGATGIGRACARRMAEEGARVIVTDINGDGAGETAATIGDAARAVQHDVTSRADWEQAIAAARDHFGGLNILVNNAGICIAGDVEELSEESWDKTFDIDVKSIFHGCQLSLPMMAESAPGSIINISSISGLIAGHNLVAYNAAKAAVHLMSKSIALHSARKSYGVRCNSIHPSFIETSMVNGLAGPEQREEIHAKLARQIPLRTIGDVDDVAYAVVYLASDESKFVTGAELKVDGGISAM